MSKPKDFNCKCGGLDPDCPACEGTGVLSPKQNQVNDDFMFNVPVDPERPFWRMHPSTHVTCALCRRKIKRRKFDEHLTEDHPDYKSDKGKMITYTRTKKND
jgi:hypothetical protein